MPLYYLKRKENQNKLLVSKHTITKYLLVKQDTVLIISDMSIKNNIATLISHIHRNQEIITKFIHYD